MQRQESLSERTEPGPFHRLGDFLLEAIREEEAWRRRCQLWRRLEIAIACVVALGFAGILVSARVPATLLVVVGAEGVVFLGLLNPAAKRRQAEREVVRWTALKLKAREATRLDDEAPIGDVVQALAVGEPAGCLGQRYEVAVGA